MIYCLVTVLQIVFQQYFAAKISFLTQNPSQYGISFHIRKPFFPNG